MAGLRACVAGQYLPVRSFDRIGAQSMLDAQPLPGERGESGPAFCQALVKSSTAPFQQTLLGLCRGEK